MEVGTSPLRWTDFRIGKRTQAEREERISRTKVTRLDYLHSGAIVSTSCTNPNQLREALREQSVAANPADQRTFRLFVVEDLSRDVIELLGSHLDIEPAFFREQIFDYAWYNTRDRWVDSPRLDIAARKQRWIQLRFATARYFKTAASFRRAAEDFDRFNVLRRAEDDLNNKAIWDEVGAIVGLTRTRASFWVGDQGEDGKVGELWTFAEEVINKLLLFCEKLIETYYITSRRTPNGSNNQRRLPSLARLPQLGRHTQHSRSHTTSRSNQGLNLHRLHLLGPEARCILSIVTVQYRRHRFKRHLDSNASSPLPRLRRVAHDSRVHPDSRWADRMGDILSRTLHQQRQ